MYANVLYFITSVSIHVLWQIAVLETLQLVMVLACLDTTCLKLSSLFSKTVYKLDLESLQTHCNVLMDRRQLLC